MFDTLYIMIYTSLHQLVVFLLQNNHNIYASIAVKQLKLATK